MLPTTPAGVRGGERTPPIDAVAEGVAPTLAAGGEDVQARVMPVPVPTPGPAAGPRAAGERPWGSLYAVRRDGSDGERYPLAGEWVEIGRPGATAADLVFEDRYLAPRHARLEQQPGNTCRVVPIDLLNGVYRRIRAPQAIPTGTQILIGRELLRFELVEEPERGEVPPLHRFGVTMFGSPPRAPWGRLMQVLASGGLRDVRHLHGIEVVLGREDGDIVFRDDEFLSRRHAILKWQSGQCVLEDLKSSNGTFVRLRGPHVLESGDTLRMGDQMFRIELGGA
jgi:pSer/pThr/pTyr-binding forkhead associated (FHA) protein